jgi:hypothetical protein
VAPEGLTVVEHSGGCGVLKLTGLTLRSSERGLELLVALRNEGDTLACSVAFSFELFGASEEPDAAGVGGSLMTRFYRLASSPEALAACAAPGDVTLLAVRGISSERGLTGVSQVEYWCNYWALEGAPEGTLEVTALHAVASDAGARLEGALQNHLSEPVPAPAVALFSLSAQGRPLDVVFAEGAEALLPGESWAFRTSPLREAGVTLLGFPTRGP